MKSNPIRILLIAPAFVLVTFAQAPISAITSTKSSSAKTVIGKPKEKVSVLDKNETDSKEEKDVIPTAGQDKLAQLAQTYQDRPDDNTYAALWDNFVSFTQQQIAVHKDPSQLFRSWKTLSQAGLKIIDPIGANNAIHIYAFNRLAQSTSSFVPQTKNALIQWNEQTTITPIIEAKSSKKSWAKKSKLIAVMKTQLLNLPSNVDIKDANLLPHVVPIKAPVKTISKGKSKSSTKISKVLKPNSNANHYLAILGTDLQSGYTWLSGLKQTTSGWTNYPDLFQDVPSFLVQSNSAKTKFSCNTLIITMTGAGGYELAMPFIDDHFAFSTKEAQDSANAVAHQFLMAIQYKRLDLAKVWLSDPKLASIPAYLGLFNRSIDSQPLRLINMQPPLCGGSRFRLATNTKDDLIIDVAKIKNQWLIKGIFIAPGTVTSSFNPKTSANSVN